MSLFGKNGGYADFSVPMDFYELWRGITTAFMDFLRSALKIFGINVDEGKSTVDTTEA